MTIVFVDEVGPAFLTANIHSIYSTLSEYHQRSVVISPSRPSGVSWLSKALLPFREDLAATIYANCSQDFNSNKPNPDSAVGSVANWVRSVGEIFDCWKCCSLSTIL
jgi:hypothetical protein